MPDRRRATRGVLIAGAALAAAAVARSDAPLGERLQAPSWAHVLGTDELGRDVLLRIVHAVGGTASVVLPALAIGVVIGAAMGAGCALPRQRWLRWLSERLVDATWSLPGIVLAAASAAWLGRTRGMLAVVFGLTCWVPVARFVDLELRRHVGSPFVTAWRALGWSRAEVVLAVARISAAGMSSVVLSVMLDLLGAETAIAFVGLGPPPPAASLGALIRSGMAYAPVAWWLLAVPIVVLAAAAVALWAGVSWWGETEQRT